MVRLVADPIRHSMFALARGCMGFLPLPVGRLMPEMGCADLVRERIASHYGKTLGIRVCGSVSGSRPKACEERKTLPGYFFTGVPMKAILSFFRSFFDHSEQGGI